MSVLGASIRSQLWRSAATCALLARAGATRANFALAALFVVGLVNYLDRTALSVLQMPIKAELGLSDSQLGALTGLLFVIPYAILSIPLGRVADRWNRKHLMVLAIVCWSVMTCLSGLAQSFMMLVILRMGVAIGEAACLPTSYSLLADYFPPEKRGRATAVFALAHPLGSMLGLAGVGAIAAAMGWRPTFFVVGALGLVIAPLLMVFFKEPPRSATGATGVQVTGPLPLRQALGVLWRNRTYRFIALGAACQSVAVYAMGAWSVPFYVRSHGMSVADAALLFGALVGVGGAVGVFLGGLLSDWVGKAGAHRSVWVPAITCGLTFAGAAGQFLAPSLVAAATFGGIAAVLKNAFLAPTYAVTQSLVGPGLRGLATAVIVTCCGILGGGVGPLMAGWISDTLSADFGAGSLRYGVLAPTAFALVASGCYALAAVALKRTSKERRVG